MRFYELIHTRCKSGMDMQSGRLITSEGYKEYAFSSEMLDNPAVDIPYLTSDWGVRSVQPYADPGYMQDGYIYHVPEPDTGQLGFMLNFHPIPWDKCFEAPGFSNRPGNFINQAFVGDFAAAGFYPYELFGDRHVWDAQEKLGPLYVCGEGHVCKYDDRKPCAHPGVKKLENYGYYYKTPPTDLPARELAVTAPKYDFQHIGSFIAAGGDKRQQALKTAVAFMMDQFANPNQAERKFLVIKESSTENIHLWLAAIQCAFSPHMAAKIPFATRMERFDTRNRYTISKDGRYQVKANLRDPNRIERHHAMIIGVDESDKTHPMVRAAANAPYVVLDGINNTISYEADTSAHYFGLITSFDQAHAYFTRIIAQSFLGLTEPSRDICTLYDCYMVATALRPGAYTAKLLLGALDWITKYQPWETQGFEDIWLAVEKALLYHMTTEAKEEQEISHWLQSSAHIANIPNPSERIVELMKEALRVVLYEEGDIPKAARRLAKTNSAIVGHMADIVLDYDRLEKAKAVLSKLSPVEGQQLVGLYVECYKQYPQATTAGLELVTNLGLYACYRNAGKEGGTEKTVAKIIHHLMGLTPFPGGHKDPTQFLMEIARKAKTDGAAFGEFIVNSVASIYKVTDSDKDMQVFCGWLDRAQLANFILPILKKRFQTIATQPKKYYLQFLEEIRPYTARPEIGVSSLFTDIDREISYRATDPDTINVARLLLNESEQLKYMCFNAAHAYGLQVTGRSTTPEELVAFYKWLAPHGFPSLADPVYVTLLAERLAHVDFRGNSGAYEEILGMITLTDDTTYLQYYARQVIKNAATNPAPWENLFKYVAGKQDKLTDDAITAALNADPKHIKIAGERLHPNYKAYFDYLLPRDRESFVMPQQSPVPSIPHPQEEEDSGFKIPLVDDMPPPEKASEKKKPGLFSAISAIKEKFSSPDKK